MVEVELSYQVAVGDVRSYRGWALVDTGAPTLGILPGVLADLGNPPSLRDTENNFHFGPVQQSLHTIDFSIPALGLTFSTLALCQLSGAPKDMPPIIMGRMQIYRYRLVVDDRRNEWYLEI